MRDAGHRTPDAGHRTAKKAKIIYPPPRGVDIIQFKTCHTKHFQITGQNTEKMSKKALGRVSMALIHRLNVY